MDTIVLPMEPLKKRAVKYLDSSLIPGEKVVCQISNGGQELVLTDKRAMIIKVGFMADATFGGKVTSFNYANITSVEVKVGIISGTFEISAGGIQNTEKSGLGESGRQAPNVIQIASAKHIADKYRMAQQYIYQRMHEIQTIPMQSMNSVSDIPEQIKKLAELHEQGILTDEEFSSKKLELLKKM